MTTPGKMTSVLLSLLPTSNGRPLGDMPITEHISLAGMANGAHHNLLPAKIIAITILQTTLNRIAVKTPIFSVTNIHNGICQAKQINNSIFAPRLNTTGIVLPNSNPAMVTKIKNTIHVINK